MTSKINQARDAGYNDDEILDFLSKNDPSQSKKIQSAMSQGYKSSEVIDFLSKQTPTLKQHAERKLGGPGIEFATRALTSIPNFMDSIQKLGIKGVNSLLKKVGVNLPEEDIDNFYKVLKQMGPTGSIPEAGELIEKIHEVSGGKFRPVSQGEKVLHRGAGIAGEIAGLGPLEAFGTPLKAAGTLGASGTMAALEESGASPWLSIGGGILADVLTRSAGGIAKKIGGLFGKNLPKEAGKIAAQAAKVSPSEIKQGVIDAAQRLGIKAEELPLSAQIDNPIMQGIESKLRQSSLSGKALPTQLEKTGQKLTKTYEDVGNQLSQRQNLLPSAVSQEAVDVLQRIEESAESAYRKYYSEAEKSLPKSAKIPENISKAVDQVLDKTISKLKSDLGTPAKDTLHNRLSRLKENWKGKIPTVEQVLEAKKDLNQVIKYEVKGGVDKLLEPLAGVMRQAIQSYGKSNQPFLFKFNEAERSFADAAKTFRKNPMIRSLVKGQAPEQIINKMGTVKGIREIGNVLGKSKEGVEAFNALKKYRLEHLLGSKLLNKKGEISWGNASGMLKNPKVRDQVIELIGPTNYSKFKDIVKVSQGVEEGLRKFLNTSGTATSHFDVALLVGLPIKALSYLFQGRPFKAAVTASSMMTPRMAANLMSNPEFIEAIKATAIAGKGSNSKLFLDQAKRVAKIVASEISSVTEEEPVKVSKK